ncbi:hypothetical protein BBJ28_00016136 [Nothophytophthora sp. Chile5]|nr:hypothetical protein BBJ28_00016136 [Nothophytophthora sp. Chile5]
MRSRERHKREAHRSKPREQRAGSRPPSSTRGNSSSSKDGKTAKRPRVRFSVIEAEGDASAITARATRSGFLRKQADNEPGAWNNYYFVLKPLTYLFYYNSPEDETPRGVIDLEYLTEIKRNADCLQRAVSGGENCFRVSGKLPPRSNAEPGGASENLKMRPLYLDTDDDEDAEKWMDAIRNHRFSLKKDEQFFEMVHQLRDAEYEVSQLQAAKKKEAAAKRALRVRASGLLQKLRSLGMGNAEDEEQEDELVDDDDVLSRLEAMEDALSDVQAKMGQQKQLISRLTEANAEKELKIASGASTRRNRSLTQVLSRAASKYEKEPIEEPEEDSPTTTSISRRGYNARGEPLAAARPKSVSDVHAMWLAKKKSASPVSPRPSVVLEDDVQTAETPGSTASSYSGALPRSNRSMTQVGDVTPTPQAAATARKFVTALKNRVAKSSAAKNSAASDRESEEDTVSLESTDERWSAEEPVDKLPRGWTRHESRGFPGSYYYAHVSGMTSWEVPTENSLGFGGGDDDVESSGDDLSEFDSEDDAPNAAAFTAKKKKTKKAWTFKLPRKLTMPSNNNNPQAAVVAEAAASMSPIRRGTNHHEF